MAIRHTPITTNAAIAIAVISIRLPFWLNYPKIVSAKTDYLCEGGSVKIKQVSRKRGGRGTLPMQEFLC